MSGRKKPITIMGFLEAGMSWGKNVRRWWECPFPGCGRRRLMRKPKTRVLGGLALSSHNALPYCRVHLERRETPEQRRRRILLEAGT